MEELISDSGSNKDSNQNNFYFQGSNSQSNQYINLCLNNDKTTLEPELMSTDNTKLYNPGRLTDPNNMKLDLSFVKSEKSFTDIQISSRVNPLSNKEFLSGLEQRFSKNENEEKFEDDDEGHETIK